MSLTEIIVLIVLFFSLFNLVVTIFISIFLVRLREVILQVNIDSLANVKGTVKNISEKAASETWDKKYETDLEKANERLRSGLSDL